jgi:hypothetical protein
VYNLELVSQVDGGKFFGGTRCLQLRVEERKTFKVYAADSTKTSILTD